MSCGSYPNTAPSGHATTHARFPSEPGRQERACGNVQYYKPKQLAKHQLTFVSGLAKSAPLSKEQLEAIGQVISRIAEGNPLSVRSALVKPNGYFWRLFSNESWGEWFENRTSLGKVISAFRNYLSNPNFGPAQYLENLTADELNRAASQALGHKVSPAEQRPGTLLQTLVAIDRATQLPLAKADFLPGWNKVRRAVRNSPVFNPEKALSKVKEVLDNVAEAGSEALNKVAEPIAEGLGKAAQTAVTGVGKISEHSLAHLEAHRKILTGEHKISPKSFEDFRRKAAKDYKEELKRAPKPIRVIHETARAMIQDDPEGTLVLLGSFVADVYAPGSGVYIRQAYAIHKMNQQGKSPEDIAKALVEGNAEEIAQVAVNAYVPQAAAAVDAAVKAKKVYDKRELIKDVFEGDGRALGLAAQHLAVSCSEIGDKFAEVGVDAHALVDLQEGDPKAARTLINGAMKSAVEGLLKETPEQKPQHGDEDVQQTDAGAETDGTTEREDRASHSGQNTGQQTESASKAEDWSAYEDDDQFSSRKPEGGDEWPNDNFRDFMDGQTNGPTIREPSPKMGPEGHGERARTTDKLEGAAKDYVGNKIGDQTVDYLRDRLGVDHRKRLEKLVESYVNPTDTPLNQNLQRQRAFTQARRTTTVKHKMLRVAERLKVNPYTLYQLVVQPVETVTEYVVKTAAEQSGVLKGAAGGLGAAAGQIFSDFGELGKTREAEKAEIEKYYRQRGWTMKKAEETSTQGSQEEL